MKNNDVLRICITALMMCNHVCKTLTRGRDDPKLLVLPYAGGIKIHWPERCGTTWYNEKALGQICCTRARENSVCDKILTGILKALSTLLPRLLQFYRSQNLTIKEIISCSGKDLVIIKT